MINLYCLIFGHKFIVSRDSFEQGIKWVTRTPVNYCLHCGLTKKECGIQQSENKLK